MYKKKNFSFLYFASRGDVEGSGIDLGVDVVGWCRQIQKVQYSVPDEEHNIFFSVEKNNEKERPSNLYS